MIGDVAYLLGDHQKALDSLAQSLRLFRSIWERNREARTLQSLARVNYSLGNFAEARKQIEMALEIQEALRGKVISQQLRENIFTSAQSGFVLYIDLLMQSHHENPSAGHDAAALQANERARSRSLLDLLAESHADIREGVPHSLIDLERSLQQQINAKAATRTRLLSDNRTQAHAASLNQEIGDLTSRYREIEVQIRQSSPRYAALTRPQPLTATEIQQQLDDNTVLLEFALGEKHSWLWAVTRSSVNSHQLPSSSLIEPLARKLYERLTARQPKNGETEDQYHIRVAEADVSFQAESATISQMLFGQIAGRLQQDWKGKRLAVVAPGALEYIPFAALPVVGERSSVANAQKTNGDRPSINHYRPMILDHEIINLPSASALAAIRNETAGRKPAEKTLAILADPVFEPTDSRVRRAKKETSNNHPIVTVGAESQASSSEPPSPVSSTPDADLKQSASSFSPIQERGGFSRLPFSREEAETIASLAPKDSWMKATDFRANLSTAKSSELSQYRIIHFATHGLLNSEHPELSGLVLSLVDEDGKPQDGFLRTREIYNLRLPAELIVLSGCQTALGKQIKGEALVGLTRGFIYAGARRIVASLWQVDDLATAQLMKSFYYGMLKDRLRPAAAIRAAQLDLLKQKRWSSPYFWAAFTIQGEWK